MPDTNQEAVERLAVQCILQAINAGILRWQETGWKADNALMAQYTAHSQANPLKDEWKLKWAMPQRLYHLLRDQNYDGRADFDQNPEVMRWLSKQPEMEFLKAFPLATKETKTI